MLRIVLRQITSCYYKPLCLTSHYIMLHHVTSCHSTSHHITARHGTAWHGAAQHGAAQTKILLETPCSLIVCEALSQLAASGYGMLIEVLETRGSTSHLFWPRLNEFEGI